MKSWRRAVMDLPEADRLETAIFWLEEMTGGACDVVAGYQRAYGICQQEARILAALNAAAPRVVTRQKLYRALYPNDDDVTIKIIDVLISRLRRLLPPKAIVTQWGVGYAMPEALPVPDGSTEPMSALASGERWHASEDADLLRLHSAGSSYEAMAEELDRTPRAIEGRLRCLKSRGRVRGPVRNARYAE